MRPIVAHVLFKGLGATLLLTVLVGSTISLRLLDHYERFAALCLATAVVCLGLMMLRRWAAVVTSVVLTGVGGALIVYSVLKIGLPWSLVNVSFGTVLVLPAVMTWMCWRDLRAGL